MIGSPVHPLPHSPPNPPKQQNELMVPSIVEGAMVILCQCLGPIWLSIFQFSCWERNAMSNQLSNRDRFLWSFSLHWPWISSSGRISGRYLFWFIRFECIIAIFDNCLEFFRSVHIPKQSCLHVSFLSYSNSRVMKSPFGGLNSQETSMKRTCTRDIPSMLAHQLIRQPRMNICRCLKFSATGCLNSLLQQKHQVPCCTDRIHRIKPIKTAKIPIDPAPHMKSNPKNWATHGIFTNSQPRQRCISLCRLEVIPAILNGWKWFHHHLMNTFLKGIRASMHSFQSILRHKQPSSKINFFTGFALWGVFFSSHLKLEVSFL